jgi:conjugal transfer mating pair stabilization protein TraN
LDIYRDCWKWSEVYVCSDVTGAVSDCGALETDPKCTLQSEACTDTNQITGVCSFVTRVYKCEEEPGATTDVTTCGQATCIAGVCDANDGPPDRDFASAVTAMEIAREVATYGDINANSFFRGANNQCSRKLFGIVSCCGGKVKAGTSNSAFAAGMQFGLQVGREAIRFLGSTYVHDVLFWQDWIPNTLINTLYPLGGAGYAANFSFYGVTWNSVAGFSFDPYSFAAAVAMQVLTQYLSCSTEEQVLALKKGQNLCHYVGTYCSQKAILGGCLTKKDTQCCFNSRLARIIHEQGRPQIGRGWGSAQSPDCGGFTIEELGRLDFSRMDLSEFTREISARAIDTAAATARAQDRAAAIRQAPPGSYFPPPGATGTCVPPNC